MAEVLGAGFTTLTDLVHQVKTAVGDTTSSNRKWTDDQIYLAIRNALAQAGNAFFYTDIYESLVLATGDVDYTLPDYIQRVRKVERERRVPDIDVDAGTTLDWQELTGWEQFYTPGNNRLIFKRSWPEGNTRITYERDVTFPIVDMTLAANITAGATTATVNIPSTYNIYEIQVPVWFQINNAEIVKCTAITPANTLTITRAQLGTTAAAANSGQTVTPIFVENDDRFPMYVVNKSAAYLNMLVLQNTNRGSDVAGNLTAMREFNAEADKALRRKSVRPRPRPVLSERPRRRGR